MVDHAYDLEAEDIAGFGKPTKDELKAQEIEYTRDLQPNFNLGVEFAITEGVAIDLGAFTDFSSVSAQDVEDNIGDRVHMFGGTLALGLVGKQIRSYFGVSFEYGQAETHVMSGTLDLNTRYENNFELRFDDTSTISRWTLAGFIGSNYSFFSEEQAEPPAPEAKPGAG